MSAHKFRPISQLFERANYDLSPGSYKEPPKFGDDSKMMTIAGPRRDKPDDFVPGPGSYIHENSVPLTRVVNPAWTI